MATDDQVDKEVVKCGLVMPIADWDNQPASHWSEVQEIVKAALGAIPGYEFNIEMVSNEAAIGVVHAAIVEALAGDDIVIVDVSGRNPNVMFELGMRLTFDKPVVVIKDVDTPFSFDTSPLRHLPYPRSLHHQSILTFQKELVDAVLATLKAAKADEKYSPFLRHFKRVTSRPGLETEVVSSSQYIVQKLDQLALEVAKLRNNAGVVPLRGRPVAPKAKWQQIVDRESRFYNRALDNIWIFRDLNSNGTLDQFLSSSFFQNIVGEASNGTEEDYNRLVGIVSDIWSKISIKSLDEESSSASSA